MNKNKNTQTEVKVTVHTPDRISESVKQQKINRLYDILKPKSKDKNKSVA